MAAAQVREMQQRLGDWRDEYQLAYERLQRARTSFRIGRKGRVEAAQSRLGAAKDRTDEIAALAAQLGTELTARHGDLERATQEVERARTAVDSTPTRDTLEAEAHFLENEKRGLDNQIGELRKILAELANRLLDDAKAIFCTLTKLYVDPKLLDRNWDTVIVDEISNAMSPLLFIAAAKARKRVVFVGDFYQLPPIVQSEDGLAREVLGTDIFNTRGWVESIEEGVPPPELAKLRIQRRMHPAIADVARALVYRDELQDHPTVLSRTIPEWCNAIGTRSSLVFLDTKELRPWSGKVPGSLSRFNFYSAHVAVELASLYASQLPEPEPTNPPPIGIVTPYSAQRRYIAKLAEALGLLPWVAVGTVHTFQGNECDVIIFDSVVGEPHWTARFTNPHQFDDVKRDLNVAVTRARHQFVFVGDSTWLKEHAKPTSGYGRLLASLQNLGHQLDATDVLREFNRATIAERTVQLAGWGTAKAPKGMTLLTEANFYPVFQKDLGETNRRAVLFTPYVGKKRWPQIAPHLAGAAERGVEVIVLHKPLSDWPDRSFGEAVVADLKAAGANTMEWAGVHAKTIVLDGAIVYEGSLNWASQIASYEHMWRMESREMASLVERMLQLDPIAVNFSNGTPTATSCPSCGGPLRIVNQRERQGSWSGKQPLLFVCVRHGEDSAACSGHARAVDKRAPFASPPVCRQGTAMELKYGKTSKPLRWQCNHPGCAPIRYVHGDVLD